MNYIKFVTFMLFGICGWLIVLSNTTPLTNMVSSIRPPTLPSILISSKFTSFFSKSKNPKCKLFSGSNQGENNK